MRRASRAGKHQLDVRASERAGHNIALLALVAFSVAFLGGSAAHAGKPKGSPGNAVAVHGEWTDCNTMTESRPDGDNQVIMVAITEKFTGTLNGTYEGTERNVAHKDGSAIFNGSGVFTGEVNGRSGTAIMTYSGTVDVKGFGIAHWVLDHGTDELAGVDGLGTFTSKQMQSPPAGCTDTKTQSAFTGTYTGTVQFGLAAR